MIRALHPARVRFPLILLGLAVLAAAGPLFWAHQGRPPQGEVLPGDFFPPTTLDDLNAPGDARVDLSKVLGTKPVVLVYWIAGNERSEDLLVDMQELVQEAGSDKVALYGVVVQRPERGADVIKQRIEARGIEVPVLDDTGFLIGRQLGVQSVPNVTILDASGRLRLVNGVSLSQTLEYKMDLAEGVRRVAETGKLGTYGYLDRYFPVTELVGQAAPDFRAPTVGGDQPRSWSDSLFASGKLNVLIFWSVDCPHCRTSLPEINDWLKQNPDHGLNVVSAAFVPDSATEVKTREFCDLNEFVFPTLEDRDRQIANRFQVTTTPTIVIVGPDGTIDSVMLSDVSDFGRTVTDRRRALLEAS